MIVQVAYDFCHFGANPGMNSPAIKSYEPTALVCPPSICLWTDYRLFTIEGLGWICRRADLPELCPRVSESVAIRFQKIVAATIPLGMADIIAPGFNPVSRGIY